MPRNVSIRIVTPLNSSPSPPPSFLFPSSSFPSLTFTSPTIGIHFLFLSYSSPVPFPVRKQRGIAARLK